MGRRCPEVLTNLACFACFCVLGEGGEKGRKSSRSKMDSQTGRERKGLPMQTRHQNRTEGKAGKATQAGKERRRKKGGVEGGLTKASLSPPLFCPFHPRLFSPSPCHECTAISTQAQDRKRRRKVHGWLSKATEGEREGGEGGRRRRG